MQQELVERAKSLNVTELASRYVQLRKCSSHEWQGSCPKCGGEDRLHVSQEWWFCRQCHPKRGDAIGWVQWMDGLAFPAAVERLTGESWPARITQDYKDAVILRKPAPKPEERDPQWFENAAATLAEHQAALLGDDTAGVDYLMRRGLAPRTWAAFGLGFAAALNRDTHEELPAIAMPWYRGGKITAIRYRFLAPTGKQKITSLPGSRFGGLLFGGQALPDWMKIPGEGADLQRLCTLVLCEGEINAMSIWQVTDGQRVHVLSLGSESASLPDAAVELAKRYGAVIVWMDKPEIAKTLMGQIFGAYGYASPAGQDANDMLQAGTLGGQVAALRWQTCKSDDARWALLWEIWDAARYTPHGLDGSTAQAFATMCKNLGRAFDLREAEPGRWVTERRLLQQSEIE